MKTHHTTNYFYLNNSQHFFHMLLLCLFSMYNDDGVTSKEIVINTYNKNCIQGFLCLNAYIRNKSLSTRQDQKVKSD